MKRLFGKLLLVAVVIAVSMSLMLTPVSAKKVIKLAHIDPADPFMSAGHASAVVFKSMVETGTNGEIEVRLYPSSTLGNERESMAMLRRGTLEVFLSSAGGLASVYPLVGIMDTPFAMPNMSVAWDVLDGWFGERLKDSILEKTGIRCLEVLDQGGFFHFTNNRRPITSLQDMQGIKFRTMSLPSHIHFFRSMGASAIPISWAEVYTSLQTGVVDGQHNPFSPIMGSKLYEVQKYLTLSSHIWSTWWFLVNEKWFASLTEDQQNVVRDAAKVAKIAGRGITKIYESTDKGFATLQKSVEVNSLSMAQKDEFAKVTIPAMTEFIRKELGDEGVALQVDLLKAIKESREKLNF